MANQVALGLFAQPGSEIVVEASAHIVTYEQGGASALWGAQLHPIRTADGLLTATAVRDAIRPTSWHYPATALVTIENTHNAAGGRVMSVDAFRAIAADARDHGVPVHLDGARLWNAAAVCGGVPNAWAREATTVMVSFSKGLGCPAGACLAGPALLMERARRLRRRLGGGMRQSGILAGACSYALDHHLPELERDHERATLVWDVLRDVHRIHVTPPDTNIVMVDLDGDDATVAAQRLEHAGLRVSVFGSHRLRVVMHRDVSDADVREAADILSRELVPT
jgi:threonine aldolase